MRDAAAVVREGMQVHAAEGEHIGLVVRLHERHFTVEHGQTPEHRRHFDVDYDDVANVSGDDVYLAVRMDHLVATHVPGQHPGSIKVAPRGRADQLPGEEPVSSDETAGATTSAAPK